MDVNTVDGYIAYAKQLAALTGAETRLSDQVDEIWAARQRALANAPKPPLRVALLSGEGGGEYLVAGTQSFVADAVKGSGGEPVGPAADRWVTLSAETMAQLNPQVVFVAGDGNRVLRDPRFASWPAVRARTVYEVQPDVLLRTGPRVRLLIESMSNAMKLAAQRVRP